MIFNMFKKKKIHSDVISDSGVVHKTDAFSVCVIIFSILVSVVLIGLGAMALMIP